MTEKMLQANDSMTIGNLRLECEKEIQEGAYAAQERETQVGCERVKQDKEHVLQPFTLMSHKPNYILFAAHNAAGYNSEPYDEAY